MVVLNGYGGKLKVNTGTFYEPNWVMVGEVREWQLQLQRESIDISTQTNEEGKAGWNASIPGWRQWAATFNYFVDPSLPTQTTLEDFIIDDTVAKGAGTVQLQFSAGSDDDYYTGEARVTQLSPQVKLTDMVTNSASVEGTGYLVKILNGVTEPPIAVDFFGDNLIGPAPLTVKFYNRSTGVRLAYQWDVDGDADVDYTEKNPTHVYTEPGMYDVKLTASNLYGTITKTISRCVEVLAMPTADFAADVVTGAAPLRVNFTATASCPGNPTLYYSWDIDGDDKIDYVNSTCEHIYHKPGVYNVTLIVRNRIAAATVTKRAYVIVGEPIIPGQPAFSRDSAAYKNVSTSVATETARLEAFAGPTAFARTSAANKLDGTQVAIGVPRFETVITQPSFSRASAAYKNDFTSVTAGTPRFESAGLTIEEATVNLVGGQHPTMASNGSGIVTTWNGNEVTFDFTNWSGTPTWGYARFDGGTYTLNDKYAYRLEMVSGDPTKFNWRTGAYDTNYREANIGVLGVKTDVVQITNSSASRLFIDIVIANMSYRGIAKFRMVQIEHLPRVTSYTDSSRSAEIFTIPTMGTLSPTQGTVEMLVNMTPVLTLPSGTSGNMFGHRNTGSNNQIFLVYDGNGLYYLIGNATGTLSSVFVPKASLTGGVHRFAFRWSTTEASLWIDGVKTGTPVSNPNLPAALAATVTLGANPGGNYSANTQYSDVVFSNKSRSDAELQARGVTTPLGYDGTTSYYLPLTSNTNFTYPKITSGLTIEENTTNVCTNGSFETNTTGWTVDCSYAPTSFASSTDWAYYGTKSAKLVSNATNSCDYFIKYAPNYTLANGSAVTFSAYVKPMFAVSVTMAITINVDPWTTYATKTFDFNAGDVKRLELSYTNNTGSDITNMRFDIRALAVATNKTLYFDGVLVEAKTGMTSFIDTTRNAETLTIPSYNVLNLSQGTVECVLNVTPDHLTVLYSHYFFWHSSSGSRDEVVMNIRAGTLTGYLTNHAGTGGTVSGTIATTGLHRVAFKWDSSAMSIWCDGVKLNTTASPSLPTVHNSIVQIGSAGGGVSLNSQMCDLVISRVARSDAQMQARGVVNPLGIDKDTTYYLPLTSDISATTVTTGLTVEEATANLCTNPHAEAAITGWGVWSDNATSTVARSTTWGPYKGTSIKVTIGASDTAAACSPPPQFSLNNGEYLSYSFRIYALKDITVGGYAYDWQNSRYIVQFSPAVTMGAGEIRTLSMSRSTAYDMNTTNARVSIDISATPGDAACICGVQIEKKLYPTSFYETTRAKEVFTIPTAGAMNPTQGTVEMVVNVTPQLKNVSANRYIFSTTTNTANGANGVIFNHSTGNTWQLKTVDEDGNGSYSYVADSLSLGPHRFALRWSPMEMSLWIDGTKYVPVTSPHVPKVLADTIYMGLWSDGNYGCIDAQISNVVISSRPRSDAELIARGTIAPLAKDPSTMYYMPLTSDTSAKHMYEE